MQWDVSYMAVDLEKLIDLAGVVPFDKVDEAKLAIENFCSENIAVVVTNKSTNVAHGTHFHDSYEFTICHAAIPSTIIENKLYDRSNNTLFAVNPMEEHGVTLDSKGFSLCGIHIDKTLVENVAMAIYGSPNILFSNDSFVVNHDISLLVRLFLEELRYKQLGHEFMIENLSLLIIGNLIRQIKHNLPSKPHNISKGIMENIKKAIDYMNENYTVGVSNTELSNLIKMDKYSFIRNFKVQTGKTPYEYLLGLKVEKAKKMLKGSNGSITEISMMCGFSSHSHFTTTFKKKTGVSPTEYRLSP